MPREILSPSDADIDSINSYTPFLPKKNEAAPLELKQASDKDLRKFELALPASSTEFNITALKSANNRTQKLNTPYPDSFDSVGSTPFGFTRNQNGEIKIENSKLQEQRRNLEEQYKRVDLEIAPTQRHIYSIDEVNSILYGTPQVDDPHGYSVNVPVLVDKYKAPIDTRAQITADLTKHYQREVNLGKMDQETANQYIKAGMTDYDKKNRNFSTQPGGPPRTQKLDDLQVVSEASAKWPPEIDPANGRAILELVTTTPVIQKVNNAISGQINNVKEVASDYIAKYPGNAEIIDNAPIDTTTNYDVVSGNWMPLKDGLAKIGETINNSANNSVEAGKALLGKGALRTQALLDKLQRRGQNSIPNSTSRRTENFYSLNNQETKSTLTPEKMQDLRNKIIAVDDNTPQTEIDEIRNLQTQYLDESINKFKEESEDAISILLDSNKFKVDDQFDLGLSLYSLNGDYNRYLQDVNEPLKKRALSNLNHLHTLIQDLSVTNIYYQRDLQEKTRAEIIALGIKPDTGLLKDLQPDAVPQEDLEIESNIYAVAVGQTSGNYMRLINGDNMSGDYFSAFKYRLKPEARSKYIDQVQSLENCLVEMSYTANALDRATEDKKDILKEQFGQLQNKAMGLWLNGLNDYSSTGESHKDFIKESIVKQFTESSTQQELLQLVEDMYSNNIYNHDKAMALLQQVYEKSSDYNPLFTDLAIGITTVTFGGIMNERGIKYNSKAFLDKNYKDAYITEQENVPENAQVKQIIEIGFLPRVNNMPGQALKPAKVIFDIPEQPIDLSGSDVAQRNARVDELIRQAQQKSEERRQLESDDGTSRKYGPETPAYADNQFPLTSSESVNGTPTNGSGHTETVTNLDLSQRPRAIANNIGFVDSDPQQDHDVVSEKQRYFQKAEERSKNSNRSSSFPEYNPVTDANIANPANPVQSVATSTNGTETSEANNTVVNNNGSLNGQAPSSIAEANATITIQNGSGTGNPDTQTKTQKLKESIEKRRQEKEERKSSQQDSKPQANGSNPTEQTEISMRDYGPETPSYDQNQFPTNGGSDNGGSENGSIGNGSYTNGSTDAALNLTDESTGQKSTTSQQKEEVVNFINNQFPSSESLTQEQKQQIIDLLRTRFPQVDNVAEYLASEQDLEQRVYEPEQTQEAASTFSLEELSGKSFEELGQTLNTVREQITQQLNSENSVLQLGHLNNEYSLLQDMMVEAWFNENNSIIETYAKSNHDRPEEFKMLLLKFFTEGISDDRVKNLLFVLKDADKFSYRTRNDTERKILDSFTNSLKKGLEFIEGGKVYLWKDLIGKSKRELDNKEIEYDATGGDGSVIRVEDIAFTANNPLSKSVKPFLTFGPKAGL